MVLFRCLGSNHSSVYGRTRYERYGYMIDLSVSGQLPKFNFDLSPAMSKIADRLALSLGKAHENEGYGRWHPTREGKPATLSGLRKTEKTSFGQDFAEIRFKNTIHQHGGIMNITEKMRGFFWARWYETKEDKWKWMALSKRGLTFPVRALTLQKDDFTEFRKILLGRIFNISEERI